MESRIDRGAICDHYQDKPGLRPRPHDQTITKQTYARSILPRAPKHTTNGTGRNDRRSKPVPQRQTKPGQNQTEEKSENNDHKTTDH